MRLGTSEAIRLSSSLPSFKPSKQEIYYQWLAGLIDGDGSFLLSKKGYASLEITMDLRDEHALQIIKQNYGGSIKLRAGIKAIRYRLHHREGLLLLINNINGLLRNPIRIIQLNKLCVHYDITLLPTPPLIHFFNGWLAGLMDSDGTITLNTTNAELAISISQKNKYILDLLIPLYKGNVYIDNSKYISWKWYITNKEDIINLIEYFKVCPLRSAKKGRAHLIPQIYELIILKAHLTPLNSLPNKALSKLVEKFNHFNL